jgi:hypothetical protein
MRGTIELRTTVLFRHAPICWKPPGILGKLARKQFGSGFTAGLLGDGNLEVPAGKPVRSEFRDARQSRDPIGKTELLLDTSEQSLAAMRSVHSPLAASVEAVANVMKFTAAAQPTTRLVPWRGATHLSVFAARNVC